MSDPTWLAHARAHIGIREIPGPKHHPLILRMWQAIKRRGIRDDETAWCAAFVGWCLESVGIVSSRFESARSYLDWGIALDRPIVGAVCVIGRPGRAGAGHVFFVTGRSAAGGLVGIGGNQGNAVSEAEFSAQRIADASYRWPSGVPIPPMQPLPVIAAGASTSEA